MDGVIRADSWEAMTELVQQDFEGFFRAEYEGLLKAMFLVCRSQAEAEDISQEAMARAFERWDHVSRQDRPLGYVYRIAFNVHRRRLLRRKVGLQKVLATLPISPTAEEQAARIEAGIDVRAAIRALPRAQREVLMLVAWLGLTAEEAGAVLGLRAVSVRARLHRARRSIRSRLGGTYE